MYLETYIQVIYILLISLQEGENDIFMINNISGDKFKIKLDKVKGDL